jgi:hypothetical protein
MKIIKPGDLVYIRSSTNKVLENLGVGIVISCYSGQSFDGTSRCIEKEVFSILWRGNIENNVDKEWIVPIKMEATKLLP